MSEATAVSARVLSRFGLFLGVWVEPRITPARLDATHPAIMVCRVKTDNEMMGQNPVLFTFWWTLAHVVGFAVVKAIGDSGAVLSLSPRTRLLVRGAVVGIAIGAAEWLVLWGGVDWSSRWALATAVGYGVGFPLGEVVQGGVGRHLKAGFVGRRFFGQAVFGSLVGVLQGLVLMPYASRSIGWWILASCVVLAGADTSLKAGIRYGLPVRAAVLLLGIMVGAGTGGALLWFLH